MTEHNITPTRYVSDEHGIAAPALIDLTRAPGVPDIGRCAWDESLDMQRLVEPPYASPTVPKPRLPRLPPASAARKAVPLASGLLDYFPDALAAVAALSKAGNDKHNPGEPLHWSRDKSPDHADCIMRHLLDRGTVDPEDGILHDVKVAWRALALAQIALERYAEARNNSNAASANPGVAK